MKKVIFITPMFNSVDHLHELIESVKDQTNENWEHIIIDDMSTDNSFSMAHKLTKDDDRFRLIKNTTKKYALSNIVEASRKFENDNNTIIAILDGDDALCNENTVNILLSEYTDKVDTAWTMHTWDINNINESKQIASKPHVDPYQHPWVSSHLKTFRSTLLKSINNSNFKNLDGEWFISGCDQALYLPLLHVSKERKFINEICYLFRMNSSSAKNRRAVEKEKFNTINLVRARGYLN